MSKRKKMLLSLLTLAVVAGGVFYYIQSRDHYDPSKYNAKITPASDTSTAPRDGLSPGTRVELTLPNQFDTAVTIGPDITIMILAFSKQAGGTVRGYLEEKPDDYLSSHNAVFIADISPFPVVLRNTFALPMLRKSPYFTLLLYEEEMSKSLKRKDQGDLITIATLSNNIVESVIYLKSESELARVFQ